MSPPQQPYRLKLTTATQLTTIRAKIRSADTINTIIIMFTINTTSSLKSIRRILKLAQNSVYPTIFTLIHNLITCTSLRTNHLKSDKNTFTMAKYPPKRLEIPSNQRTSIHRHVNMKRLKKLQQQSSRKTEATKVNAIIEQLDQSDRKKTPQEKQHQSIFITL